MTWFLSLFLAFLTSPFDSTPIDLINPESAVPDYSLTSVVIDAGHGGKDPGCLGAHHKEKDIALSIALSLGAKISEAYPDVEVIYTRKTDIFIPLHERAKIANRAGADLFVSIHCNTAAKRNGAIGTETYIMGLHRAKDNLQVAKRENSAILHEDDYVAQYDGYDPESDEGHIILSMYQNAHLEQSITLAHAIETQFTGSVKRKSRGVKQAGFLVLRNTAMPSVLVETGFLSHDDEEAFLSSAEGQTLIADGIFNAFSRYKAQIELGSVAQNTAEKVSEEHSVKFYVQLAASSSELDLTTEVWKAYGNVVQKEENDYYKYLAGPFNSLSDAKLAQSKFSGNGFKDAFVVSYEGDKKVPVGDAISKSTN